MAFIEYTPNAIPAIEIHESCSKHWGFGAKLISERMYISGRMKTAERFGKILMYMPN